MRSRGKGWFENEYGIIYVQGTVDKKFYRKTTNKKATKINLKWIEKNHRDVLLKIIAEENESENKAKDSLWFKEFAKEVLALSSNERNEAGQKDLESKLKNHIIPYFEKYKLTDMKPLDIERWQLELLETKASGTVKKCRDIISRTMKSAVANDLITKNPCDFAKNVRVTHEKTIPYTEPEVRLMIEKADGWLKMFLILAISTGLRTGEVMALKWEDINLEEGFIDLERSITKGIITDASSITNRTKNHQRIVELISDTKVMLANYHMSRPHEEWLFVSKYKEPFKESKSIVKYHFKPLLKKLGIQYKSLKATRHTFTSMMLNNGFDKAWVKAMLGHSPKSTVTDEHYFQYQRNDKRLDAANNFFNFNRVEKDA